MIRVKRHSNYYGTIVEIEDGNTSIDIDISKTQFEKNDKGEYVRVDLDIDDNYLNEIISFTEDVVRYRKAEFDGSALIEYLVDKLPSDMLNEILNYVSTEIKNRAED
jgi:hypothetical protein